jgi:hypothetical protein
VRRLGFASEVTHDPSQIIPHTHHHLTRSLRWMTAHRLDQLKAAMLPHTFLVCVGFGSAARLTSLSLDCPARAIEAILSSAVGRVVVLELPGVITGFGGATLLLTLTSDDPFGGSLGGTRLSISLTCVFDAFGGLTTVQLLKLSLQTIHPRQRRP